MPLSQIKYIIGPCQFFQFNLGDRMLYIFGESHEPINRKPFPLSLTPNNSLLFPSFINSVVAQHPEQTYDFMYESLYFLDSLAHLQIHSDSQTLKALDTQFKNCINIPETRECEYANLRVHTIDFRLQKNVFKEIGKYRNTFATTKYEFTRVFKSNKIQKQINAIKNTSIRDGVVKFFTDIIKSDIPARLDERGNTFCDFIMDLYAIPRLLRDFDPTIKKTNQFSGTSKNVIYYTGNFHSSFLKIFLMEIFLMEIGIHPEISIEGDASCTDNYIPLDISFTKFK